MLKIQQILQTNQPFKGVSQKTQKPYSVYSWIANIMVDGQGIQGANIKAFKEIDISKIAITEYNYKKDEYHNPQTGQIIISYMLDIPQEKKPWGNSKPTYTLKEYDDLWIHAVKKFADSKFDTNRQEYISTYIISACNAGVKVETKQEPAKTPEQIVNQSNIQPADYNPFPEDEKLPF
jgi:hypothetical protein